ncbi:MAG: redoxin domain-containing protein [Alphaproteobacteria bacterium]|nr:redoxin domain-containing protein [Alphaproteobacteria bacterium]
MQDFEAKNTAIVGCSFDAPEDNRAFRDKFSFPFDLLSDADRAMSVAYGAAADAEAERPKRISVLIGPDGTVLRRYDAVTPADHPDEVLADLG